MGKVGRLGQKLRKGGGTLRIELVSVGMRACLDCATSKGKKKQRRDGTSRLEIVSVGMRACLGCAMSKGKKNKGEVGRP